jgi:hypothetical protein
MGFTLTVILVIAAIVTVIALDLFGAGWAIRLLWRSERGRRVEHSIAGSLRRLFWRDRRSGDDRR